MFPSQLGISKHHGDDVFTGDAVRLECDSQMGHNVLCIRNTLTSRCEVRKAVTDSTFILQTHINSQDTVPGRGIRGAAVITLWNLKHEAYLAGRGSLVSETVKQIRSVQSLKGPKQRLRMSMRSGTRLYTRSHYSTAAATNIRAQASKTTEKHRRYTSNSGDTFWQVENFHNPLNGNWLKFGTQVRIKHLPSQKYLSVKYVNQQPKKLTLKQLKPHNADSSKFSFTLIRREKNTTGVMRGSFIGISHNGVPLGLEEQSQLVSEHDKELWKYERVYTLVLMEPSTADVSTTAFQDICTFKIEVVPDYLLQQFYYAFSAVQVLNNYTTALTMDALSGSDSVDWSVSEPLEVVKELTKWVEHSAIRANMLRTMQVFDLTVVLLQMMDYKKDVVTNICTESCNLMISYLEAGNSHSRDYLQKNPVIVDVLFKMIRYKIGADRVLTALDKEDINVSERLINTLINTPNGWRNILLKQDDTVLDLLGTLCFSKGKPVRKLQHMILSRIFKEKDENVEDGITILTHPEVLGHETLKELFNQEVAQSRMKELKFFIAKLKLYSKICNGVNVEAIEEIIISSHLIQFKVALACVRDPALHPSLRAAYLELIIASVVDKSALEFGTEVDYMWHTFKMYDDSCEPMSASLPAKHHMNMDILHAWIESTQETILGLLTLVELDEQKMELNTQLLNGLEVLGAHSFLAEVGYPKFITKLLLLLLTSAHDKLLSLKPGKYMEGMFKVVIKVIKILQIFFKQYMLSVLKELVHDFRNLICTDRECSLYLHEVDGPEMLCTYSKPDQLQKLLDEHLLDTQVPAILTEAVRSRMKYYFEQKGEIYQIFSTCRYSQEQSLVSTLIGLMECGNDAVKIASGKLLFDLYQAEHILFSEARISHLCTSDSNETAKMFIGINSFTTVQDTTGVENLLQTQGIPKSLVELGFIALDRINATLTIPGNQFKPNHVNQDLAYSTGLFKVLQNSLLYYCKNVEVHHEELMQRICNSLQKMARKNEKIQQGLFDNYLELLDSDLATQSIAELLTEMFTDNENLCNMVPESDIVRMFHLASTSFDPGRYELYSTLKSIILVSKANPVVLTRFQDIIIDQYSKGLLQGTLERLLQRIGRSEALHVLRQMDDDNRGLTYLLNGSDLLSTCMKNTQKFPEKIRQFLFSLEYLIEIVTDENIAIERKTPFACLITEAYLTSDRDSLSTISSLMTNQSFWDHVESVTTLIISIAHSSHAGLSVGSELCNLMHFLSTRHLSVYRWKTACASINVKVKHRDSEVDVTSALLYILDAFVPMINTFCLQLHKQLNVTCESDVIKRLLTKERTDKLHDFGNAILELSEFRALFSSATDQLQKFSKFLNSLTHVLPHGILDMHLLERKNQLQANVCFLTDKEDKQTKEGEMNKTFQQFVTNFHEVYKGKSYGTDFLDPGKQLLPDDPYFSLLIRLFLGYKIQPAMLLAQPMLNMAFEKRKEEQQNVQLLFQFLEVLHQQLQQGLTNQQIAEINHMLHTCLQIICAIFYTTTESSHDSYETTDRFVQCIVKPLQDQLIFMDPRGAHEYIMDHMSNPDNRISVQAMAFLESLMRHGNKKAQELIRLSIQSKNTDIFVRMDSILSATSSLVEAMSTRYIGGTHIPRKRINSYPKLSPAVSVQTLPGQCESLTAFRNKGNGFHNIHHNVTVVLQLLASMCDGQDKGNQDLLREQEAYFNSVNIVTKVAILLQDLADYLDVTNIHIAHKAIQALIEVCAANFENQKLMVKTQIVDIVNTVLSKQTESTGLKENELMDVKSHILELLEVLLEETTTESHKLCQSISRDINVGAILDTMMEFWKRAKKETGIPTIKETDGIFTAYHVLRRMANTLNQPLDKHEETEERHSDKVFSEMWEFVRHWSRSIEVVFRTNQEKDILTQVYFPQDPNGNEILKESKKDFISTNIVRKSHEEKVTDLLKWMVEIHADQEYKKRIHNNVWLRWTLKFSKPRHNLLKLVTIILCLILLIVHRPEDDIIARPGNASFGQLTDVASYPLELYIILYFLGAVHLVLTIWMVIEHFVTDGPNLSYALGHRCLRLKRYMYKSLHGWVPQVFVGPNQLIKFNYNRKLLMDFAQTRNESAYKPTYYKSEFSVSAPFYRIFYIVFSMLALSYHGLLYTVSLLYVFTDSNLLEQVIRALRKGALQLLVLFLLGMTIIFIYATLAFILLQGYFDPAVALFCNSLFQCFLTIMKTGLLEILLPLKTLDEPTEDPVMYNLFIFRVIFDLSFFLLITVIGINLVVAILVDRFSEIRSERDEIREDKQNSCFICGIDSETFEGKGKGFQVHITEDHSKWNYVYFYSFLKSKSVTDYNAMQKYVYKKIQHRSIQFFPHKRALVLERKKSQKEKSHEKKHESVNQGEMVTAKKQTESWKVVRQDKATQTLNPEEQSESQ